MSPSNTSPTVTAVAEGQIGPINGKDGTPASHNKLPPFPKLSPLGPTLLPAPPALLALPPELTDIQDIAKEAMRLTKETLQKLGDSPTLAAADSTSSAGPALPPPILPQSDTGRKPAVPSHHSTSTRLNKFVRRLHDMLQREKESGIVQWKSGLLVLQNTDVFAKEILPKYFNTRNFKTFRRQLNYYGFVHVRSFSNTSDSTTALWVNRELAETTRGSDDISNVLLLKRVEPCESAKTAEGRRARKELAISTVEQDLGMDAKTLQAQQIRSMTKKTGPEMRVVLEHQNYNTSTTTMVVKPEQPQTKPTTTGSTSTSSKSPKPLVSNASAANLLLMLSKAY